MNFKFDILSESDYMGGSYLMDFGKMETQEDAALVEGKLRAVFGVPEDLSENSENSFNYFVRVTADDGRSVMLNVYNMGVIHIGAAGSDEFTVQAANALVEYVSASKPADFQRTVYYLDYDIQMDVSVVDGTVTVSNSQISPEKAQELFQKFYF